MMALGLLYPVGAVLQGFLAGAAGLRAVTMVGACLLAVVVLPLAARPRRLLGGGTAGGPAVIAVLADG